VKRATIGTLPAAGLLLFLGVVLPASADRGYADFSIWNRSLLYRDPMTSRPTSAETVFHLQAVQDITNYGSISLYTDALFSGGSARFSRIAAGWSGFKIKGLELRATLGDESFVDSNLEARFVNQYHPYVYFRGLSAAVAARSFDLSAFGGKVARLSGLLGSTYEIRDQPLFGLKGRWKSGEGTIVGAALIHTRPDLSDLPNGTGTIAAKNTLIMVDAEAPVSQRLKVLGEFRTSMTPEESPSPGAANALRFGPLFRAGKWDVEANYRFFGSRFQDVSPEAQIGRDERGLFASARYQASRNITLFSFVDRRSNNTDRDAGASTIRAWSVISGFHFNTRSLLNLTAQWELQDRVLDNPLSGKTAYGSNGVFIQASQTLGTYFPYVRIRLQSVREASPAGATSFIPSIYAGFRKIAPNGSSLWIEAQFDQKSTMEMNEAQAAVNPEPERIISDRTIALRAGWNHSFNSNLDLYAELFYERYGRANPLSQLVGYAGLRIGLPKNIDLRIDLRATEPLNGRTGRASYYQLNLRMDKRFSWGLAPKVLGRQLLGGETVGLGTIDGFVFEDKNRDGLLGPEEKGLPGVALRLEDGSRIVTGSDGRYRFENVAEGPHQVRIEENRIPASYYLLSPARVDVLIQARQTTAVSYLLISGAGLTGRFVDDVNRDGKFDPQDKGLADINVILTPVPKAEAGAKPAPAEASLILNTFTDAEGKFRFVNILPGEYELSVDPATLPQGAAVTITFPFKLKLEPGQTSALDPFLVAPRPVIRKK